MKEIEKTVEKLRRCEEIIAAERGQFDLFGLFLRDDAPDKWDLVVGGQWFEENEDTASLAFLDMMDVIRASLSKEEMLSLSRVVVLKKKNPELEVMYETMGEGRNIEIEDMVLFGLQIKKGYIITLQRRKAKGL
jgi:hypothetical protein